MKKCPGCGAELDMHDKACPSCRKKVPRSFTILDFLWENFRLFTMIGITGTMISLIPNMGNRVLGASWINATDSLLPLFLSIIIFFGAIFLSICFLMIFALIIQDRDEEPEVKSYTLFSRTLTWREGDFQRFILLFCLVPMWFGLLMFFILLMPLIPNQYSWYFAVIVGVTCIPLLIYSLLGWKIGKIVSKKVPVLARHAHATVLIFIIAVVVIFMAVPFALPQFFGNTMTYSGDVEIRATPQYYAPHISSAKGMRLEVTNLSPRELLASRQVWYADYGYFIRVIPSTGEVTVLGNPADNGFVQDIYWTFSGSNPDVTKKPVKISVHVYPLDGENEITNASLNLYWYNNEIVYTDAMLDNTPLYLVKI